MKWFYTIILFVTVILLVFSGCIQPHRPDKQTGDPHQPGTIQQATTMQTQIPAENEEGTTPFVPTLVPATSLQQLPITETYQRDTKYRDFTEAAQACYHILPIKNIATDMAFTRCVQQLPSPTDECEKEFIYWALESTNDDSTTAGYKRETERLEKTWIYFNGGCKGNLWWSFSDSY